MEITIIDRKRGAFTILIDESDQALYARHTWHIQHKNGKMSPRVKTILYSKGKYTALYLHRLIMDAPKGLDVDHINGNGLDNRRENLRLCTRAQNHANRRNYPSWKSSSFKGVSFCKKSGKWVAQIAVNGKSIILGKINDEITAAELYNRAAIEYYGEFAHLNDLIASKTEK